MIGILDVDIGNLRSLSNAVYSLGYDFRMVSEPSQFEALSHLLIPGVGAYGTAMQRIEERGVRAAIVEFAATGAPVLGICLGMQILSSWGEEGGRCEGLGIVPGRVVPLDPGNGLTLPHVGWNTARFSSVHPVLHQVKTERDFYFVHSYHFVCEDARHAIATCDYGQSFNAIVASRNVLGFQFHPEKSQTNGLKLLENFCAWNGRC